MPHRLALLVAPLVVLGGCELIKKNEEATSIVSQRVVGMQAGDFFDSFGRARRRTEVLDGSTVYDWESAVGSVAPGVTSLDERVCKLRVVADRGGRIVTAEVVRDTHGRTSASRCGELFRR